MARQTREKLDLGNNTVEAQTWKHNPWTKDRLLYASTKESQPEY